MKDSSIFEKYSTFYVHLRKNYKQTIKDLCCIEYDQLDLVEMDEDISACIYEILNDNDFKLTHSNAHIIEYNPLFLLSSLNNDYADTIKLLVKENQKSVIKTPNFTRENNHIERLLLDNDFVLNSKNLSLAKTHPAFLLASLKNDYDKTIRTLKKHDLFIIDVDNETSEKLINYLFYNKKEKFKNLPNVLENIIVKYIHNNRENKLIRDLAFNNLVPVTFFPKDIISLHDEILEKGCENREEYNFLYCKIDQYSSDRYRRRDEDEFLSLMSKKYGNCSCVEDIIKIMYNKKKTREDMSLMEVFAFQLYACKILKEYGISNSVDVFAFDKYVECGGSQNDKGICMYISGECSKVYDMLRIINHEIEHVFQKELIKNNRIDLDNDINLYSKDFILTEIYGKAYYDQNNYNLSFEYDAEYKSAIRTSLILNLTKFDFKNSQDIDRLFHEKQKLINFAKKTVLNGDYYFDISRDFGRFYSLNGCFEETMEHLRKNDKNKYKEMLDKYPIIRYEYNYENTFSRKTISELLEDLDKADNKEKGIYYNLLKSRFNDDKEEYVEDNQDEILNEYKKVKYSSVTKRMIGDLINKFEHVNDNSNSYINRAKKDGR